MNHDTACRSVLLVALLAPGLALAMSPVDDFERGLFAVSAFNYQEHVIDIPGSNGHAMHVNRKVILESSGDYVLVSNTNVTPFTDRALTVFPSGSATVRLHWDWALTRDLTVLGTVDRVEMVVNGPAGGKVTAIMTDDWGGEGEDRTTSGGTEVLTFYLSDWSAVDPTDAESFGFRFNPQGGTEAFYVSEVRFRRSGSLNVDFVGNFVATQVPPIPSSPLRFSVYDEVSNPLYQTDMVIRDASASFPVEMTANWQTQWGAAGDQGAVEFRWDENGVFSDLFFEMSVDFASFGDLIPEIYPPDPFLDDPTSFALGFPVCLRDDGEALVGESNTMLTFDVDATQGAEFAGVTVTPRAGAPGGSVTGFDLCFYYLGTTGVEVYEPLFHARWVSDWQLAASLSGQEVDPVAPPTARLLAVPSVTRGATEIRYGEPFGDGVRLWVHDVTGRRVRSLDPLPGRYSTPWDGLSAGGQALPSGVYFVRLQDAERSANTRVTLVR